MANKHSKNWTAVSHEAEAGELSQLELKERSSELSTEMEQMKHAIQRSQLLLRVRFSFHLERNVPENAVMSKSQDPESVRLLGGV